MAQTIREFDSPAEVLAEARRRRAVADRAEADQLMLAADWAAMHSADSIFDDTSEMSYGDRAVAIAGPGAPLVAEFAIAELAAALNLSTDAGRSYLAEALELRYRLPRLWQRVVAGDLVAWKARRVAAGTIALSAEAAAYVDIHVAHVAHRIGPVQLTRLIEEAIARFMPSEAEKRRQAAADGRHFTIDAADTSLAGTTSVWGELDVADALDLDAAVTAGAEQLKAFGSTESLDVRRATAVGELARQQQTLDLTTADQDNDQAGTGAGGRTTVKRQARQVVLYVHLADAAITDPRIGDLGRLENIRGPITAEQVRSWCATPDTEMVVKPVIDLSDHPARPGRHRWPYMQLQPSPLVSSAPPAQDPRRVDLHAGRARHLPVAQPAGPQLPA